MHVIARLCVAIAILVCGAGLDLAAQDDLSPAGIRLQLNKSWDQFAELIPQARCDVYIDSWSNDKFLGSRHAYSFEHLVDSVLWINHLVNRKDALEASGHNGDYFFVARRRNNSKPWRLLSFQPQRGRPSPGELYSEFNPATVGKTILHKNLASMLDQGLVEITAVRAARKDAVKIDLRRQNDQPGWQFVDGTVTLARKCHLLIERASFTSLDRNRGPTKHEVINTFSQIRELACQGIVSRDVVTTHRIGTPNERIHKDVFRYKYSNVLPVSDDFRLPRFGLDEDEPIVAPE